MVAVADKAEDSGDAEGGAEELEEGQIEGGEDEESKEEE
jgi:hypothetical protein